MLPERRLVDEPVHPPRFDRAHQPERAAGGRNRADELLRLQRFVGNAAVSDLLRREHRYSVVVDRPPGSFVRTLGSADPDLNQWTFPRVALTSDAGGVRFAPTVANRAEGTAAVCPVGEHSAGNFAPVGKDLYGDGSPFVGVNWTGAPAPGGRSYEVRYVVDAAFRATLVTAELEHLDDFALAFSLSAGRLAAAVNGLTSQSFPAPASATAALVAALADAQQLVPQDPNDLGSWQQRVVAVASELTSMSMRRDESDHIPITEFEHSGEVIRVRPRMKDVHRPPAELVKLDGVTAVYAPGQAPQSPSAPVPTGPAHLKDRKGVELFKTPALTGDSLNDLLKAGTRIRVVSTRGAEVVAALAPIEFTSDVVDWTGTGADLYFAVAASAVTSGDPPREEVEEETPDAPPVTGAAEPEGGGSTDSSGGSEFDIDAVLAGVTWDTGDLVQAPAAGGLGPPPAVPPPPPPT